MADTVEGLRAQLADKEGIINMMKNKTRAFVQSLNEDHKKALSAKDEEVQKNTQQNEMIVNRLKELKANFDAVNNDKAALEKTVADSTTSSLP